MGYAGVALPKIVYPSSVLSPSVSASLLFARPPRKVPYVVLESVRHDNTASSGVREVIWERTDQFLEGELEYVATGNDIEGWVAFEQSGLQGIPFDFYPDQTITTPTVLTFTAIVVSTGFAVYSYSSFTGPAPKVGQLMTVTAFSNDRNNVTGRIIAVTGTTSGTVSLVLSTQAAVTEAGTGTISPFITYYMDDKKTSMNYKYPGQFDFKHRFFQYVPWM